MTGYADLVNGIAPGHTPVLLVLAVAAVLAVPASRVVRTYALVGAPWSRRLCDGWAASGPAEHWAAGLLAASGLAHLALPLGHADSVPVTAALVASGVAYLWLAHRTVTGRRWRLGVALLVPATLVSYLVVAAGGEEIDQVGLATALVELAALGLALGRRHRALGAGALCLATLAFGVTSWLMFLEGHDDHGMAAVPNGPSEPHGGHDHGATLARAQAGVIMRPGPAGATEAQRQAAAALAERVRVAAAKYRDVAVARADGYSAGGATDGLDVHFEHEARTQDDTVLDPAAPEHLVYAVGNGRAVLLGVVFQMPHAGQRGPQVGGALTPWHTHNICIGSLPLGFGLVTPFGNCPFLTTQVTIGEMMHVWVVDNPAGTFADSVPEAYARRLLARDGRPAAG